MLSMHFRICGDGVISLFFLSHAFDILLYCINYKCSTHSFLYLYLDLLCILRCNCYFLINFLTLMLVFLFFSLYRSWVLNISLFLHKLSLKYLSYHFIFTFLPCKIYNIYKELFRKDLIINLKNKVRYDIIYFTYIFYDAEFILSRNIYTHVLLCTECLKIYDLRYNKSILEKLNN